MTLLTFALAMLAYLGLTVAVVWGAFRHVPGYLKITIALLVATHVLLVWGWRYDGQLAQATRNGYLGFGIFHAALGLLLAAPIVNDRLGAILQRIAFGIVTCGAIGAVFRYDDVAWYRVPVIACAVAGSLGLLAGWRNHLLTKKKKLLSDMEESR
ncbi:MAG: hypothetical protein HY289_15360 [Planctomycetes bacterium]|nr:hypothetical protein [Planctomycetota bacterium]